MGNLGGHFWVLFTLLLQVGVDGGMRLSCLLGLDVTVRFRGLFEAWVKASVIPALPFDLVLVLVISFALN